MATKRCTKHKGSWGHCYECNLPTNWCQSCESWLKKVVEGPELVVWDCRCPSIVEHETEYVHPCDDCNSWKRTLAYDISWYLEYPGSTLSSYRRCGNHLRKNLCTSCAKLPLATIGNFTSSKATLVGATLADADQAYTHAIKGR
jgi:hypothetical protein